jgi:hypothetical protein
VPYALQRLHAATFRGVTMLINSRPVMRTGPEVPQEASPLRGDPGAGVPELELILSHVTQKPMLRGEVGARALRVRSDVRGHGQGAPSRMPPKRLYNLGNITSAAPIAVSRGSRALSLALLRSSNQRQGHLRREDRTT